MKELRLIRWANDGYPPIDLSNELEGVLELIREVQSLRNSKVKKLHIPAVIKSVCTCSNKEKAIKHFSKNYCEKCKRTIVQTEL